LECLGSALDTGNVDGFITRNTEVQRVDEVAWLLKDKQTMMAMGPVFTGRKLKALLWDGWIMSEWRQLYFLIGKKHVFFSKLGSVVA
jgi:hypothetical protein